MTTFYLIRHGQIDANVNRLWHGSTDSPLNQTGIAQAEKMADKIFEEYPQISCVYTSPLKRTLNTARALSAQFNQEPVLHPGLREYGVGEWEGHEYETIINDYQFMASLEQDNDFAPPGGDSLNEVRHRVITAFDEIRDKHSGEHVAIVSHGAAIAIALSSIFNGQPYPFFGYHMDNTAFSILHWGQEPELVHFNQVPHL
ncbi:MAG: putative phosphoglycerate mutase [Candidatus Azotimanducaceae bacterium]|jgi:probable phosphoglycerate mutase